MWKSQNEGYNKYMSERWASNTMLHQRMAISNTITLLIHNIKVKRVSLLLHIWRSCVQRGMRWCSWLRHCATSQKTVGSIPDGVIGIFHWHNPSSYTMALGSTQPLKKMSTRNISWVVKAANSYSSQPYHLHVLSWNVGISGWKPSGPEEEFEPEVRVAS